MALQGLFSVGSTYINEDAILPVAMEDATGNATPGLLIAGITVKYAISTAPTMIIFLPTSAQWVDKGDGLYLLTIPGASITAEGRMLYRVERIAGGPPFRGMAMVERRVEDYVLDEPTTGHTTAGTVGATLVLAATHVEAKQVVAYNEALLTLSCLAWLTLQGQAVIAPTSVRLRLKKNGATTEVDLTSTSPNSDGVFSLTQAPLTLDADSVYEALVEIVYDGITYKSAQGAVTYN